MEKVERVEMGDKIVLLVVVVVVVLVVVVVVLVVSAGQPPTVGITGPLVKILS